MHPRLKILLVVVALVACGFLVWSGLTGRGPTQRLPEGPQTLTGSLVQAELSLKRRGTHVLKVDGEDVAYVESTIVNLRMFELTTVGITGTFVHNSDPSDLPVLIATSVQPIEIDAETVDLPTVGLTVRVPTDWNLQTFDDGVAFSLTGSSTPLLRIMKSSLTRLPAGTPMLVGGYDAVRDDGEHGTQVIHLNGGRTIVTFTWTSDDDAQDAAFAQLLRTAIVRNVQASSSARSMTGGIFVLPSSAATGGSAASVTGPRPCGGPAGVLCPSGSYCAVNSPDGVGTCVPL